MSAQATDLMMELVPPEEGCTVVAVAGEIDLTTGAETLRDTLHDLISSGSANLVIDLSGVRFLDSTALGVLIGAMRAAGEQAGDVHLVRDIARYPGVYRDNGRLTAGLTLGIIGTLLALVFIGFIVVVIILAIAAS